MSVILKKKSEYTLIAVGETPTDQIERAIEWGWKWKVVSKATKASLSLSKIPERALEAPYCYRNIVKLKKVIPNLQMDSDVRLYYEEFKDYMRTVKWAQRYVDEPWENFVEEYDNLKLDFFPDWVEKIGVQVKATLFFRHVKKGINNMKVGQGKTFVTLSVMAWAKRHEKKKKFLVIAPILLIKFAWIKDIEKFNFPFTYHIVSNKKNASYEIENNTADILFISSGLLPYLEKELKWKYFDYIAFDESSVLKVSNKSFNVLRTVRCDRLNLLSATPAPNSTDEFFGQMFLIGCVLGNTVTEYRNRFMYYVKNKKDNKRPGFYVDTTEGTLRAKKIIKNWMFISGDNDLEGMPERIEMVKYFSLGKEQRKHYENLEEEYITYIEDHSKELKEQVPVVVKTELVLRNKLLQCINGFLIDVEGNSVPIYKKIEDSPKYQLLKDNVDKIMKQDETDKIIIWGIYQDEIQAAAKLLKKYNPVTAYGRDTKTKKEKNIQSFLDDPKTRVIIAHPKSVKFGHTWTHARYMIWMSVTESYEDLYQGRGRNRRIGSKYDSIFEIRLVSEDTIEEKIYQTLVRKQNLAKLIESK